MRAYKSERKAEEKLRNAGLEYFIPKRYAVRLRHGKKCRELVPVIPSLLFVRSDAGGGETLKRLKKECPFLQYAMSREDGRTKFMIVPDKQMDDFMRVANSFSEDITYYHPDEIALEKGQRIKVHGGMFDGIEGVLVKVKGVRSKKVVVLIEGIMAVSTATIEPDLIEVIPSLKERKK